MQNSLCRRKIDCAHAAKLCYTLHAAKLCNTPPMQNSLRTRDQAVQHAVNEKLTAYMQPSCATRSLCEIHFAHAPKLCNTRPMQNSLCTRGQVVQHAANAKFTAHTLLHYAKSRKAFKCCVIQKFKCIRKLQKLILVVGCCLLSNITFLCIRH
jgi:hypothetical protein